MKPSLKIKAALAHRLNDFSPTMPSGQKCVRPGSQNRKKGFSSKRKR